jgi:hypothetical protein
MTNTEILEQLKKLTAAQRLTVIEAALRLTRADLEETEQPTTQTAARARLAAAAQALLQDYEAGGELTAFTALDGDDLHA